MSDADRRRYIEELAKRVFEETGRGKRELSDEDRAARQSLIESGDIEPGRRWTFGSVDRERFDQ